MVRNLLSRDRRPADADQARADGPTTVRIPKRDDVKERPTQPLVTEPKPVAPPRWARTSTLAALSLMVGTAAVIATFTGLLAPVGVALGVTGGAIAAGGLVGASRRGVTGHGVALLGLVLSLGAVFLGVLAISGHLSWLSSRTDEVARLRDWLNVHIGWFKHW
ncbi:MAG TPA: hypothetical protein VJT31_20060 [Rugosimonospora sp.]|nr:hypothetical protein [Rugosimonospora sp.]